MTTLPLFRHELLDAPRVTEPSITNLVPLSRGLPEDGVDVYVYIPSHQRSKYGPIIDVYKVQDGMWVPNDSFSPTLAIEAVTWWIDIESIPAPPAENSEWIEFSIEQPRDVNGGADIWIWNSKNLCAESFWCEGSSYDAPYLYYGAAGDPVLHDEFVSHWMFRKQPEFVEWLFADQIENWEADIVPQNLKLRQYHHSHQLKLDLQ